MKLPNRIFSGHWKEGHVQGIAIDRARGYVYYSFTTILLKTDLLGNPLGSVENLVGHLGCITMDDENNVIYGSLELKHDAIGAGIINRTGWDPSKEDSFYLVCFDLDKIDRMGMDAEKDGVMKTVYLPTVLEDFQAQVAVDGKVLEHRSGCSGIDGVAFGPELGHTDGKEYLTVAYGIYGDTTRMDNDYQVLLQYDVEDWKKYESPLSQDRMHTQGPANPRKKCFVLTGNTTYGVQNLEYDAHSRQWFMAVYKGNKPHYPNHYLFAFDAGTKPTKQALQGVPYLRKALSITQVKGWAQNLGSTGLCSLDNGWFYISHAFKNEEGQGSTLRLHPYHPQGNPF